jgi:hypothetical protein
MRIKAKPIKDLESFNCRTFLVPSERRRMVIFLPNKAYPLWTTGLKNSNR